MISWDKSRSGPSPYTRGVVFAPFLTRTSVVPSQLSLRPFDVAVALRLHLVPEDRYEPMAAALATSTSAVHRSVARLHHAGLCVPKRRTVQVEALHEFLVHGVRYAFPALHGPPREGLATAGAHPALQAVLGGAEPLRPLVWPMAGGGARGDALVPLFAGVTKVASGDPQLHRLLACVDVLRTGSQLQRQRVADLLFAQLSSPAQ